MKKKLISLLEGMEIKITDDQYEKLEKYFNYLKEKNENVNLTAIRDDDGIIEKHFWDSIILMRYIKRGFGNAIDIGTGAGFPGMVLAILNPDSKFTLLDSVGKKIKFLEELVQILRIENVELVSERSEEFIKKDNREKYDIALCRGVAELRIILEYTLPFLKVGGKFYPQKLKYKEELEMAGNALKELGACVENVYEFSLPISKDERTLLEIKKTTVTDKKYPRKTGIPKKRPL